MDAGWVAAIASLASAFIVAVTAVAAFRQIGHSRSANETAVYLRVSERLDSLESGAALASIETFAARVRSDPELRARLATHRNGEDFAEIAALLDLLEHFSTLIVTGDLRERLVLAEYADSIAWMWDRLAETIYLHRLAGGPYYCAALEHLAMKAKRYLASGAMDRLYGRLLRDPRMRTFEPSVGGSAPVDERP